MLQSDPARIAIPGPWTLRTKMDSLIERGAAWLTPQRIRLYPTLVCIAILITWMASMALGTGLMDRTGSMIGADFAAFYTSGRFLLDGRMDQLYDFRQQLIFQRTLVAPVESNDIHPFVNPPFTVVLYVLFSLGGYIPGLVAWMLAGLALLLITLRILRKELFPENTIRYRSLFFAALVFFPTLGWILYCQNTTLTLLMFSLAFVMLRRQRDFIGGLALGFVFIKPQLLLAPGVMLLTCRRWKALIGLGTGVGLWCLVGLIFFPKTMIEYAQLGPVLFDFLRDIGETLGVYVEYPKWGSHGFFGFCVLLLDGISHRGAEHLATILTLAGLGAVAFAWHRTPWQPGSYRWDMTMAATVAMGLLISPHLFYYDLMLLLLPLIIVCSHFRGASDDRPLDGGPLLVVTAALYVATFTSSAITHAQLALTPWLGLPEMAVQISMPIIIIWVCVVYHHGMTRTSADNPT